MVHYDPGMMVVPNPPPMCPKCGSHRTEIVGLADDGQTIVVRCNACGARSELKTAPVSDRAAEAPAGAEQIAEWQHP